ncbi:tRNA (adenosine(37)-N6)-dimethylallyltransferase MiaA [Ottowia sp.]|jgi:tRNA dimethylallyltransferase|uniref:tRNA (adenosine(37)-N6)-dimethylallyltransferase MiaA n=1 Tax=Ottowia sp. TaxID=1898956 RepID=UPI0025F301B7|nr:tRNA (adenosine(37)-N6)-dimethylallyltransferase MiaA [Ottowia sp.]MBK6612675.1 tRNA (adenosine(37)-N6)-dimethylallyltransferase MiaA [Ottowia sp.]MBK6748195.1 tRNA (adenosine(37)-N6)-dimethylallyltransferase MiaA [Ottowia sp.]
MANPTPSRPEAPIQALCLAGPTASGKSALALALAERWPVEVISVDSALVYRGMDIGTAKPTPGERAAAPHHLIDIRDPREAYSAAEFARDARRLMGEIRARGRLPLLVGGTMLYFKALLEGLDALPAADPAVRAALEAEARARGWPALHAELARVDPATAARLAPADGQRIQRALEVWRVTGRPLSTFHTAKSGAADEEWMRATPLFSLEPRDRAWLHERIARRFDAMLAGGFLDEVAALRARGDLTPDLPSMRCIGYRQAWEALEAGRPLAELRERGIAATRQLAKRQLTWLRGMAGRHVLAIDQEARPAELAKGLLQALGIGRA